MTEPTDIDLAPVRHVMAVFEISPRVEPNEEIDIQRVFFPEGHRNVLDVKRQLVIGNRGMGKSFWAHALMNPAVREKLALTYSFPKLGTADVIIGFNGSVKISGVAPTVEQIGTAHKSGADPELIWRAVILRAVRSSMAGNASQSFADALEQVKLHPGMYSEELTSADDAMTTRGSSILIVFDALDRFSHEWGSIRNLTKGLLMTAVGLQSFRSIRAKIFMRVDQFADTELFRFPDSSKIRNDRVDLAWRSDELYGLMLFELLRQPAAGAVLEELARRLDARSGLPAGGRLHGSSRDQEALVTAVAGEYMGRDRKRGRVYTWVPLHLGDAANNCSPRTFLTAWKTAAEHRPPPQRQVVDHLGLNEGVRRASSARLTELREDYPWIDLVLEPLRRHFVPIEQSELFRLWNDQRVTERIVEQVTGQGWLAPIGLFIEQSPDSLLQTMISIGVMEKRANGKINVPDIFRVEASILRKGGVAVPRRN